MGTKNHLFLLSSQTAFLVKGSTILEDVPCICCPYIKSSQDCFTHAALPPPHPSLLLDIHVDMERQAHYDGGKEVFASKIEAHMAQVRFMRDFFSLRNSLFFPPTLQSCVALGPKRTKVVIFLHKILMIPPSTYLQVCRFAHISMCCPICISLVFECENFDSTCVQALNVKGRVSSVLMVKGYS